MGRLLILAAVIGLVSILCHSPAAGASAPHLPHQATGVAEAAGDDEGGGQGGGGGDDTGTDDEAATNCIGEQEDRVQIPGDAGRRGDGAEKGDDEEEEEEEDEEEDEGATPEFSPALYAAILTLDVSADGLDGRKLPISIEEVCDVPEPLAEEAAQLAGADGVAVVRSRTKVFKGDKALQGTKATKAIDGADTATVTARLKPPEKWGEDEDGEQVATFRAKRIEITD